MTDSENIKIAATSTVLQQNCSVPGVADTSSTPPWTKAAVLH
jgi:hypothetical protein